MNKTDLEKLLQPIVNQLGYELWGCDYLQQGKHSLLRIYIDKEDGIGVADCELVSRDVSTMLDVEDPITGNYSLEISSPGIPRPLFYKEQFDRYIGSEVELKLYKPLDGSRKVIGTICSTDSETLIIDLGDSQKNILFSQIVKANLIGE